MPKFRDWLSGLSTVTLADDDEIYVRDTSADTSGRTTVAGLPSGGTGSVSSVNGETGIVVLDADDIDDTSTTNKFATAAQLSAVDALHGVDAATATRTPPGRCDTRPSPRLGTLAAKDDIAVPGDITATGTASSSTFLRGDGAWATPAGGGGGDLLAANNLSDVADAATSRTNLGLAIGTNVQAYSSVLDATTASYTTAEASKLSGIEAGADVTDATNVTAAGALMDSEVDADIKTLSLPANTTISPFGASLIDDAAASNARSTLGLGNAATLTVDADLATFVTPS